MRSALLFMVVAALAISTSQAQTSDTTRYWWQWRGPLARARVQALTILDVRPRSVNEVGKRNA